MVNTSMSTTGIASQILRVDHYRPQQVASSSTSMSSQSSSNATSSSNARSSESSTFSESGGAPMMVAAYGEGEMLHALGRGGVKGSGPGPGWREDVSVVRLIGERGGGSGASSASAGVGQAQVDGPPVLRDLDLREKSIAEGMAAVISALVVNPLDVAKVGNT
ncbi:hypothetical protein CBR_g33999 [Chara braunii]|uniref:Uncharacterized protein n=1 Tax=Chara braunii TaxID=69332 RepID=A0A388LHN2_CHABU|nr:hypothetical protein CBR_g33999 [Chara braunii]|eukprot:GBG81818.1 hypothetical protein CBR_g33999 [Chara braunii]